MSPVRRYFSWAFVLIIVMIFFIGCAPNGYVRPERAYPLTVESETVLRAVEIDPALEEPILALDPEHISGEDVSKVLSHAPAPRIMKIHGGIYPVYLVMESFSRFLIKMGYPQEAVRNPNDGSYSYSCYDSGEKLAGILAWHYEREGMRPMIIGHSQGGMQAVKVLYELAGKFDSTVNVWNPLTNKKEERHAIIDPLTGTVSPVVGLKLSYVSAVGAGGLTRLLPNQWIMAGRLRKIPDSVEEFTGFSIGIDFWGGDVFGLGSSNLYQSNGSAVVRNVKLPASYNHVIIPVTSHLAKNREMRAWINSYTPVDEPHLEVEFDADSMNILWAADVWYSIKKHWTIELQRLIRAKRRLLND